MTTLSGHSPAEASLAIGLRGPIFGVVQNVVISFHYHVLPELTATCRLF